MGPSSPAPSAGASALAIKDGESPDGLHSQKSRQVVVLLFVSALGNKYQQGSLHLLEDIA